MRESAGAVLTLLTAHLADPTGYGRIVRDPRDGSVARIVEEKDCTPEQRAITEVNTGTYCFDSRVLFAHLDRLTTENVQGEYYLTDMVSVFIAEGLTVSATLTDDPFETLGVNSRVQLADAAKLMQRRINHGASARGRDDGRPGPRVDRAGREPGPRRRAAADDVPDGDHRRRRPHASSGPTRA